MLRSAGSGGVGNRLLVLLMLNGLLWGDFEDMDKEDLLFLILLWFLFVDCCFVWVGISSSLPESETPSMSGKTMAISGLFVFRLVLPLGGCR